ncbi:MAG TPA: methyltransferase [Pirellulales bacterium]
MTDQIESKTGPQGDEPPRPEEALLLSLVEELAGAERVVCTSLGRGQFAAALARRFPETRVHLSLLDVYQTEHAQRSCAGAGANLSIACEADFPTGLPGDPIQYDAACFPVSRSGEAELVRDRLQAAYLALKPGGRLIAAIDYSDDKWLHGEIEALCGRVERRDLSVPAPTTNDESSASDEASAGGELNARVEPKRGPAPKPKNKRKADDGPRMISGVIYIGKRGDLPKKLRNFHDEFAYRDAGRLIRAISRPGVFSHRRLDLGARKILDAMEIRPGERVVDLGCGAGTLSFAAALRAENVIVRAVDSSARAIEATLTGAKLNDLTNITADLSANGVLSDAGTFSLVLANPPYYSGFKLARVFLDAAHWALAPNGRLLLVTQFPEWYLENAPRWFEDVTSTEAKKYYIIAGRKRTRA